MECNRCSSRNIVEDDAFIVCKTCGLIQSENNLPDDDDGIWLDYDDILSRYIKEYTIRPEKYRELYFKESVCFYLKEGVHFKELDTEVLEDIYNSVQYNKEYSRLRDNFIRNPNKRNTQKILGSVDVNSKYVADKYRDKNGNELKKYKRKNFNIKWRSLLSYLIDMYQLNVTYSDIPYDIYNIVCKLHTLITSDYTTLRRYSKENPDNNDIKYSVLNKRIALPNARVFFVLILLIMNPQIVNHHLDLICLPKPKTVLKALEMIDVVIAYTYNKDNILTIRRILCDIILYEYGGDMSKPCVQYMFFGGRSIKFFFEGVKQAYIYEFKCLEERITQPPHGQFLEIESMDGLVLIMKYLKQRLTYLDH